MEIIDYRAFHKPSGLIFEVEELTRDGASRLTGRGETTGICIQCKDLKCWSPYVWERDCVVTQFTGRLDKEGKKIYAGDICIDRTAETFTVRWDNSMCGFVFESLDKKIIMGVGQNVESSEMQVIGNVFLNSGIADNKDLKKGGEYGT